MSISASLRDLAADSPHASELLKAAKKLEGFSRSPGKRAEADRIAAVLTPSVIAAIGEAYVAASEMDRKIDSVERQHALAGLLLATSNTDEAYAAPAATAVDRVIAELDEVTTYEAENTQFVASLYPDVERSAALAEASVARLRKEPPTPGTEWAERLGLDLPFAYFQVEIYTVSDGGIDAGLLLRDFPANETTWEMYLRGTTTFTTMLKPGRDATYEAQRNSEIAGELNGPTSFEDFPAVLATLEERHGLTFDRAKSKISGRPGRLLSPTKKKLIVAWLNGDTPA